MSALSRNALRQAAVSSSLRACQLLAGLPAEDLDRIADITVLKLVEKGDYLFREGQPSVGFYVVQHGSINVHRVSAGGREQVIHVFRAGDSLAEATLVMPGGYPADARALEASRVLLIQRNEFIALLRRQPELSLRLLASMSQRLRTLVGQLEDLTLKDVETRLANWLLKRCPDRSATAPVAIELPMAKRVLAAELGTVSETFSRTLARFRRERLIQVKGRVLTVVSPAGLQRFLEQRIEA
ncbi:MAG: Crp/Fnr family transcriptional regulator [Verrucomicrobiales bacterium]|nr:Crp/Fnr family transcriptional regulator [Verrucomicrobiales bacterium]MCP5525710.1 Crp/Fnr family transcriptional regulator [Verrucomicrobiales bacterium]